MDLNETAVLKEINQDINGEFLSARKNSCNNSLFTSEHIKENNKYNKNLDKTFEQENFNFTEFQDKQTIVDNANENLCNISSNECRKDSEESKDKYLVRNPVNDTTLCGNSSDEETFVECNSYIVPEQSEKLSPQSSTHLINDHIGSTRKQLSLTNLNFENLAIDDHDDIDKTSTERFDDNKSNNSENEEVDKLSEKNIKPIEFDNFDWPSGANYSVCENFEFTSDSSLFKDKFVESDTHTSIDSIMGKTVIEKDSGIFKENITQNDWNVEFKIPKAPVTLNNSKLNTSNPNEMVPASEFNFDADAFEYLLNKGELGNIKQRAEDSLLLKFDPLLSKPIPVLLDQTASKQIPIVEEEPVENNNCGGCFSQEGDLLNITVDVRSVDQNESVIELDEKPITVIEDVELNATQEIISLNSAFNESSSEIVGNTLEYESLQTDDSDDSINKTIEVFEEESLDPVNLESVDFPSGHETMSVNMINDIKIKEDDSVIETINSQIKKEDYKMTELEKKLKKQGIKSSEENDRKLKEFVSRDEALIKRIADKEKTIAKMNSVIEAYEKTISEFIAEKEQIIQKYEKKCVSLMENAQLNSEHLLSLEDTFSDLHTKYERSKQMTINLKQNEEKIMNEKKQLNELLATHEARYEKMKFHAMSQLQVANDKLENLSKNHAHEVGKLKALLKKEEISRTALGLQLQQKIHENEELVKICEELIGGGNITSENS